MGGCHLDPNQWWNLVFGYNNRWVEDLGGTQSGAGAYNKASIAVPAGYIYVAQFVFARNTTGARGRATLFAYDAVDEYIFNSVAAPATNEPVTWNGGLVLKAGDTIGVRQISCLNGDVIQAGVWGYMMKLSQ